MSFGESVFSAGFIQKTHKGDLFIKANHVYPQRNRRGKTLEDSRRQTTEVEGRWLPCGADQPHYSWMNIYFDHVIRMSQESTSLVDLPSGLVYVIL